MIKKNYENRKLIRVENSDIENGTFMIPSNITEIAEWAFYNCSSLETITIPNSVTKIGECAFEDCYSLETITIPNSVISIEYGAFSYCRLQSKEGNYKAFNKGLKCLGMRYKPYEWNEIDGEIVMREHGLHYVTNMFDIFNYYYYGNIEEDIEIWEIDPGDIIIDNDDKDSKKVTNKIKPLRKLSRLDIINILNNK